MNRSACRYVHEADAHVTERDGDNSQQDFGETRTAEPAVQGDVHVPVAGEPTTRRHSHGFRLLQPQHQTQGDDRMVLAR